jgi:hypothetical protein
MFEVSVAEFKAAQAATNWSAGDLARENTAAGSLPPQGIVRARSWTFRFGQDDGD